MTENEYNIHTRPLFKEIKLIRINGRFHKHSKNLWQKFTKSTLAIFCCNMYINDCKILKTETRNQDGLHFLSRSHLPVFPCPSVLTQNILRKQYLQFITVKKRKHIHPTKTLQLKKSLSCLPPFFWHLCIFMTITNYASWNLQQW